MQSKVGDNGLTEKMDFHHFLPSNTSPEYFPHNNASQFSTPVDDPYDLVGDWEVALMDVTFSSCIKTFNNDKMSIEENFTFKGFLEEAGCPVKVLLPVNPALSMANESREYYATILTDKLKPFLSMTYEPHKKTEWKFLTNKYYFILSPYYKLCSIYGQMF